MADQDYDFELIMALAEGTLPADEAAAAEANLTAAGRDELATQRMALAAMAELPEPALGEAERAALRANIRDELHLVPAPPVATRSTAARPDRAPWYARMFPVLAGAAALVVVVGIGLNLDFGGSDAADTADIPSAAEEPAASLFNVEPRAGDDAATATTAAATEAAAEDAAAESLTEEEEAADGAAEMAPAADAVETTTGAVASQYRYATVGDLSGPLDELEDAMLRSVQIFSVGTMIPLPIADAAAFFAEDGQAQCWENAFEAVETEDMPVTGIAAAGFGTWRADPAEFYEFVREDDQIIVVVLRADCSVAVQHIR